MRVITVVAAAIGVLHLLTGFFPTPLNWGIHHLAFLPPAIRIGVPILMLVCLIPSVQSMTLRGIDAGISLFQRLPKIATFGIAATGVLCFALLTWFAREATCFLGDGWLALRNLNAIEDASLIPVGFKNAPLPAFIMWKLSQLLAGWNIEPHHQLAFQFVSVGCGVASVLVLIGLVRLLAMEPIDRTLAFLFVIAAGGSQLFFGYVESYTPTYLMVLVFLWLSLAFLAARIHLVVPAIAFSVLVACHFGMIVLSPAVLFLFIHKRRVIPILVSFVAMTATFAALLSVCGYTLESAKTVFFSESGSHLLPPLGPAGPWNAYSLFSLWHLVDLANILLLLSPFALPVVLFMGTRMRTSVRPQAILLILTSVCGLGFALIMNFDIGMSRDWDLLSPFILATIVAASFTWMNGIGDGNVRRRMMVMMVAITLLHTTTWIAVNANVDTSVARFESLPDSRVWGTAARAYAYEDLAVFFRNIEVYPHASTYIKELLAIDSTNGRRWTSAGFIFRASGERALELQAYEKALRFGTIEPSVYGNLGIEYANQGRLAEADELLRKALEINPELPLVAYTLGTLYGSKWNRYDEALHYLTMAIHTDSMYAPAWLNIGTCYLATGRYHEMIPCYEKYLELAPESPNAEGIRKLIARYQ